MKRIIRFGRSLLTHRLAKDGIFMFAGTMVANVGAYLYHLMVGRILGKEAYSEVGALLSLVYILNVPALVLLTAFTKFFSGYKASGSLDKARSLFVIATTYLAIITSILFVLALPFVPFLTQYLRLSSPWLVVWLFVGLVFFVLTTVNIGVLQGFQRFRQIALFGIVVSAIRLIFGAIGAPLGVGWTMVGFSVTGIVVYALYFLPIGFILQKKKAVVAIDMMPAVRYMIPTFLAILGITAIYSQDVVLVKHYLSAADAGLYAALSVLGKIIYYASFTVGTILFPVLAEHHEQGTDRRHMVWLGLAAVGAISVVLTLGYGLFPTFIVRLLYGRVYDDAAPYMFSFGLFMTFFSLSYLLIQVCLAVGRTRVWVFAASAAILHVILVSLYHESLRSVVTVNIGVSSVLFFALLIYYGMEKNHAK